MMTQLTIKCVIREISTFYSVRARMCMCGSGIVAFCSHVCTRARSWREFAKSRFTHFPSILSVHVDSYVCMYVCMYNLYFRLRNTEQHSHTVLGSIDN